MVRKAYAAQKEGGSLRLLLVEQFGDGSPEALFYFFQAAGGRAGESCVDETHSPAAIEKNSCGVGAEIAQLRKSSDDWIILARTLEYATVDNDEARRQRCASKG